LSIPVIGSIEVSALEVHPVRNKQIRMTPRDFRAILIFQS